MQQARIRKFAKSASDLLANNSYEAAFVLRWIAYEGLVRRAAIKALWMRGAMVSEAQKIINQLQGPEWEDPTSLLAKCCGNYINVEGGAVPVFKALRDRVHVRNLLFHQLEVATKKSQFKQISDLLALVLDEPSKVFGDIKVYIPGAGPGKTLRLGNPLVDLRKAKREKSVPRKSVQALLGYEFAKMSPVPRVADLNDDMVKSLFDRATGKSLQLGSEKNRSVIVERKRVPLTEKEKQNLRAALFASLKSR